MRSIELFAGIGGIALAAEWAGIETVAFCEREPFCQKVLNNHWSDVPIFDDVRTLNRKALEEKGVIEPGGTIDIISGGFPCQPFSIAGNKRGKEDDRDLWPEMFRIIKELKPRWIVGENVANFVNMELDRTLFDLESVGYRWRAFVIPACAVNAKHRRERVFVVAYANSSGRVEHKGFEKEVQQSENKELQHEKSKQSILSKPIYSSDDVANSNSFPEPQTDKSVESVKSYREAWEGFARWNRGDISGTYWETNKPPICGVDDGFSGGLDKSRLKSLGNAVVPQQIYPIFKYIMEIERMTSI